MVILNVLLLAKWISKICKICFVQTKITFQTKILHAKTLHSHKDNTYFMIISLVSIAMAILMFHYQQNRAKSYFRNKNSTR